MNFRIQYSHDGKHWAEQAEAEDVKSARRVEQGYRDVYPTLHFRTLDPDGNEVQHKKWNAS